MTSTIVKDLFLKKTKKKENKRLKDLKIWFLKRLGKIPRRQTMRRTVIIHEIPEMTEECCCLHFATENLSRSLTSAPIGAWKGDFPPLMETMTDRQTDQATGGHQG